MIDEDITEEDINRWIYEDVWRAANKRRAAELFERDLADRRWRASVDVRYVKLSDIDAMVLEHEAARRNGDARPARVVPFCGELRPSNWQFWAGIARCGKLPTLEQLEGTWRDPGCGYS